MGPARARARRPLEKADRHAPLGRDRWADAREGRERAGGGCRQSGCDHGLFHACQPGGPRASVAGVGGALAGLSGRNQGTAWSIDYASWIVTVARVCLKWVRREGRRSPRLVG